MMALAASTRPRRGAAVSVTRIRRRRYSAVMNIAPTTTRTISPANVPTRVCAIDTPAPPPPDTTGAMSPVPVTVNVPAAWLEPAVLPGELPPTLSPAHAPRGQLRPTWSKTPVATLGPPLMLASPSEVCRYCGEVVNRPTWATCGRPARVAVPTWAQCVPSAES